LREKRNKIWIDKFQTTLSLRIALYFAAYQLAVWALVIFERHVLTGMEAAFGTAGWLMVFLTGAVIFQGVVFIYDAIKYSHRLVGPLHRFRKTIQAITAGDEIELVTLRQGDFLQELKDDFNDMLKVLEERRAVALKEITPGNAPISKETAAS
jgi:methyl-accepting chemotaxis protein